MTALARNLLSASATATINSLATHCNTKPSLTDDGRSITRANLIAVATACSTEQALLESAYSSDHKSGAAAVAESNAFGWTPLHYAVGTSAGGYAWVRMWHALTRATTPTHYRTALGESGAVADLLEHGANVNARTQHGLSPLHVCVAWGTTHLFNMLRGAGAELVAYDTWGRTPLALWCARGWGVELAAPFVDCDAMGEATAGRGARLLAGGDVRQEWVDRLAAARWGADPAAASGADDSEVDVWGGWRPPQLEGDESTSCDIDVAPAGVSADDIVRDYLSVHKPVLIRGALLKSKHWRRVASRVSMCVATRVRGRAPARG